LALISNAVLYFKPTTEAQCGKMHLLGPVTQFIAASVTQVVFFYQTLATSKHSRNVFGIMSFLMILVPVEGLSMTILRQPYSYPNATTGATGCASLVPDHQFNAGPVFYLARLIFDIFAIVLSCYHVWLKKDCCNTRSLITQIYNSGAGFMFLDFTANLLIFLASLDIKRIASIGSMFAIVAAMSMAQKVLLIEDDTCLQLIGEEKHQTLLPSHTPTATAPNTPGVTSAFGPIEQAQTMPPSQPTRLSYDSRLHCARGREALKFRADGDTSMFFRIPTLGTIGPTSAKSSTHNLLTPTQPTGNRPVSTVSGSTGDLFFQETV